MKYIIYVTLFFTVINCSTTTKKSISFHFPTYQITTADNKSGFVSLSATGIHNDITKKIMKMKEDIGNIIITTIKKYTANNLTSKEKAAIEKILVKKINYTLGKTYISKITINEITIH